MTDRASPAEGSVPPARSDALSGLAVMVTRPAHQAHSLAERIEAAGGRVVRFPLLEITYLDGGTALTELAVRLDTFDFAIFVSANAAAGWARLFPNQAQRLSAVHPVAVGAGTAKAMEELGLPAPLRPRQGSGADALLEIPELREQAVAGRRVLIVRGVGGRELLADALAARGATVEYLEVYRRTKPKVSPEQLLKHQGKIHAIVVTSLEALNNLFAIAGSKGKPWLSATLLVTVSPRIARFAQTIGVQSPPIVARDASDQAILDALCHLACGPAFSQRGPATQQTSQQTSRMGEEGL